MPRRRRLSEGGRDNGKHPFFPRAQFSLFLALLIKSRETTGNESASVTLRLSMKFEVAQGEPTLLVPQSINSIKNPITKSEARIQTH